MQCCSPPSSISCLICFDPRAQRLLVKYAEHDDEEDSAVAAPSVDLFHEIAHAAKLMFEARAGSDEMMGQADTMATH